MEWNVVDKAQRIPTRRPIICYCPNWCGSGYQVAMFNGKEFHYEEQPNDMFDSCVEQWALFYEAD